MAGMILRRERCQDVHKCDRARNATQRQIFGTFARSVGAALIVQVCLIATAACVVAQDDGTSTHVTEFDRAAIYDEVVSHVSQHFYDGSRVGADWKAAVREARSGIIDAADRDEFASQLNTLLTTLNASHTYYYSVNDPRRFQLLGVFNAMFEQDRTDLFCYRGIGIHTRLVDGQRFVSCVYDGLPADRAGLKYGDRILAVNGKAFHPMKSFDLVPGSKVTVTVERKGGPEDLVVEVDLLDGRTMFETALRNSVEVIRRGKRSVGYVHVWSYAGQKYHDALRTELLWGDLSECDSLVLDLRDGWGGADLNYLNLFRPPIATVEGKSRSGDVNSYTGVWGRPVVLLTNGGSTSGKELFSYGFRKLKLGRIVGEPTAGAVLAGRIFLLTNGDLLYLAVNNVAVDGKTLEGHGVLPDVPVVRDVANGPVDPQRDRALEILLTP